MRRNTRLLWTSGIAFALAAAAAAWACTPSSHSFSIQPSAGFPGDTITVQSGSQCSASPCSDSGDRDFFMDETPSAQPGAVEHQDFCDTDDEDIGNLTLAANGAISGTGEVPDRLPPGPYIVCAGIDPDALWANFVVL